MVSSSGFSPSLVIDRPGCRRTQALVLGAVLLAVTAINHGGLPPGGHAVALALVAGYGLWSLRRASPGAPAYVTRLVVTADGAFLLGLAGDPANLVPASVAGWWRLPGVAMGVAFASGRTRIAEAILFRDRVPPGTWRRLAVRLRYA